MFRLILVPFFILIYLDGHAYQALGIFCLASLTDMLDGYLARKNNQITSFGKLMDPLADKLLVISALVCHVIQGIFPWSAIVLMVIKETGMIVGSLFLLNKKNVVVHANYFGKTATCCFMAALILGFFHEPISHWSIQLDIWLLWIAVALSYLAAFTYLQLFLRQIKENPS